MDWAAKLKSARDLDQTLSAVDRFKKAVERLAETPRGERNQELTKVAFLAGVMIESDQIQEHWAKGQLLEACRENEYVKDASEEEVMRIVNLQVNEGRQAEPADDPQSENPIYKLAISASRLGTIPKAKWLVKGVLKEKSLAFLIATPGCGKSFMALDLAAHIADQREWHGREIEANGKTVYITPEGAESLDDRRLAWEKENGRTMSDDVIFFPLPINIGSTMWEYFVQYCEDIKPSVVIVDTLARNTPGQDEVKDMGPVVAHFDDLRVRTGCTTIVVHHVNKAFGEMRGSSELDGAADTVIKLARPDPQVPVMNAWITKQKNGPEYHLGKFRLSEHEINENGDTSVAFVALPDIPWEGKNNDD